MNQEQKIYYDRCHTLIKNLSQTTNIVEQQHILFTISELKNVIRKNCRHEWNLRKKCSICNQDFSYY